MRSDTMARGVTRQDAATPRAHSSRSIVLALLLGATALFLAAQNAILLFVLGPSLDWPAELEPLVLALRVGRVLAGALAPWFALGMALVVAGAATLWAARKIRNEVHHA